MSAAAAERRDIPVAVACEPATVDLAAKGLAKSLGGRRILDGVDLHVRRGQAVALIGPNGAGKSTLLRCCLRLVEPEAGSLSLLDQDVMALRAAGLRRLRARVGFVFQRHNLVPRLSALTNVIHGAQARRAGPRVWLQGLAHASVREEAMHCLERVGLCHVARQRVDSLSGGQSQRVAIARALMQRPDFVIADEPVASLDPAAGEEVMELFVDLMRRQRTTLLYTSHNLHHALAYADRLVALRAGKIALDAPANAIDAADLRGFYA
ncbi:phosphonate ABC transporter ATP-binding protein [Arenibaculum pallidiluteum]|uniref:phosphonate ABC transporter ATP-binding protein n=1 Tax=Arenibaculum pallidiluteum TaxID=2812559 RepID=UPI001A965B02|nr:ATP-binding cassette domain-containing protein [Arenibaculum pallidiluteum]